MKVYDYYKDLPPLAKGIVVVGVLGFTAAIGINVWNRLKSPGADAKATNQAINALKQKYKPSFRDDQYLTMADEIYSSMDQAVGDDYGKVQDILKRMKNDLDVALLIKAYGSRQLHNFMVPKQSQGLFAAVQGELGQEWGGLTSYRVTDINADWKKKGISYQI